MEHRGHLRVVPDTDGGDLVGAQRIIDDLAHGRLDSFTADDVQWAFQLLGLAMCSACGDTTDDMLGKMLDASSTAHLMTTLVFAAALLACENADLRLELLAWSRRLGHPTEST